VGEHGQRGGGWSGRGPPSASRGARPARPTATTRTRWCAGCSIGDAAALPRSVRRRRIHPAGGAALGLAVRASDLNPVRVLINKAMLEDPAPLRRAAAGGPGTGGSGARRGADWSGPRASPRTCGAMGRDAGGGVRRVGHLYPQAQVTGAMAERRPDLQRYEGRALTVIAWLWARDGGEPEPAMEGAHVPLVTSWMLFRREGREAWVRAPRRGAGPPLRRAVRGAGAAPPADAGAGTKHGRGTSFRCLLSGAPITAEHIRAEGRAGRLGVRLMAVVCAGDRERVCLDPSPEQRARGGAGAAGLGAGAGHGGRIRGTSAPVLYGLRASRTCFTATAPAARDALGPRGRRARARHGGRGARGLGRTRRPTAMGSRSCSR